jgi:hypothetical protein
MSDKMICPDARDGAEKDDEYPLTAERVSACLNACAGIPNDKLTRMVPLEDIREWMRTGMIIYEGWEPEEVEKSVLEQFDAKFGKGEVNVGVQSFYRF